MEIELSEEQQMLKKMASDFLTDKCPATLVKQMMDDERGYPPDLWREIADLGWLGLAFPANYGGEDGSFLDLVILLEEMGRVCFPGPFFSTVMLGGLPILYAGNEEQKKGALPKICKGELLATLALTEPDVRFNPSGVTLKAIPDNGSFTLSGNKLFVPDAHIADLIICVARTSEARETDSGITMFLVDSKSPGLEHNLLKTVDGSKQCELIFREVRVPGENVLGKMDNGWGVVQRILELAAVAKCAEMLGGAQKVLEMTVQYTKERHQFGHPIGSFQAIQHHCANMVTDVDGMRLTTYQAAWMLSENLPCRKEASIAKAWAGDAFKRVTLLGVKIHGGVAFMEDHDVSLHYKKSLASEPLFGNAAFHRYVVSQELISS